MEKEKIADPGPWRSPAPTRLRRSSKLKPKLSNRRKRKHGLQKEEDEKKPAGGFDDAPIPQAPPGFTVKFTIHRAHSLPFADFNTLSSDPYVMAELQTDLPTRHKQDPPMRWRTPTIRRCLEPVWDSEWIVANVPRWRLCAQGPHLRRRSGRS